MLKLEVVSQRDSGTRGVQLTCCTIENVPEIRACDAMTAAAVASTTIGQSTEEGVEDQ